MYLLDTNVLSELRRPDRAHPNVTNWAAGAFLNDLFLSSITILELEMGCLQMERRDPLQGRLLRKWLQISVLVRYNGRILPVDTRVAQTCARLHVPNPKPERDAMIAATAIEYNFTLITRNTADFQATGVRLLNPWLAV